MSQLVLFFIYINVIFDLHNDLLTIPHTKNASDNEVERLFYSCKNSVIMAFWTTQLENPLFFINSSMQRLGKNAYYAVEDCWFLTRSNLNQFVKNSFMYCSLTWNYQNSLAGGAESDFGLTDFGKSVIKAFNDASIAVDTAHLNRKSFFMVAEHADRIINSHSCLNSVFCHHRNLTDEQIRVIIQRKGIVGLAPVNQFLGGKGKSGFIENIDAYVQKFGDEGLCVGTDFYGTDPIAGLESYDKIENIRYDLSKMGYSNDSIDNIFYKNAKNFFNINAKGANTNEHL